MKKKGLIISTIVMVVVLIASLTTATYAWFSAASSATVDTIQMNVGAASSVAIGVRQADGAENQQNGYRYGSNLTYTSGTGVWSGGNQGLGNVISAGLTLNVTAGVGTGLGSGYKYTAQTEAQLVTGNYIELSGNTYAWKDGNTANTTLWTFNSVSNEYSQVDTSNAYSSGTKYYTRAALEDGKYAMDPSYNPATGHSFLKANGNTFDTLNDPVLASINEKTSQSVAGTDVIDLKMAINPVKTGIYGTYCVIKVTPTSDFIGMISALWADITVGSKTVTGVDLFSIGTAKHYADNITTNDEGSYLFYFMIDEVVGTEMTANDSAVTPFSLRLFISGYDEDCNVSATGTSAAIDLQFYGVTKPESEYVYEGLSANAIAITDGTTSFAHAA